MKIFFSAGEASGDKFAAGLVAELKRTSSEYQLVGIGSWAMAHAGMKLLLDISKTSSIGLVEVIRHIPYGLYIFQKAKRLFKAEAPDLFVPVDNQGINLVLARIARKQGIPVVYFIPPQNFLWDDVGRGRAIVERVDMILNIYRRGYNFYKKLGASCRFVGHPVVDIYRERTPESKFRRHNDLPAGRRFVGLIPGTREHELKQLLPLLRESARHLYQEDDSLFFLLPAANPGHRARLQQGLQGAEFPHRIIENDMHNLAAVSDFVITKSGTAALDVAVAGTPYVVVYRLSPLSYFIFAKVWGVARRLTHVSLPNILTGEEVARELLQDEASVENVVAEARRALYNRSERAAFRKRLAGFREGLGQPGVFQRAARAIATFLKQQGRRRRQ